MILVSTPNTEFLESICKEILEVDPSIRFAGFISKMGRLIVGHHHDDAEHILDKTEREMLFMEVALRVRMRSQFDPKLGPVDYTVSKREQIVVMSFPYKEYILYVSAEKETHTDYVIKNILDLLRRPKFES